MVINSQQVFWNKASVKDFHEEDLKSFLKPNSCIVEYGCGYGRILNYLSNNNPVKTFHGKDKER